MSKWSWHLAGYLRVVGTNPGRKLKAIFDPKLPQEIPTSALSVPLMINFAKNTVKIEKIHKDKLQTNKLSHEPRRVRGVKSPAG